MHTLYKVSISKSALENNINILTKNADGFIPVIKSDGYGHGVINIAKSCLEFESAKKLKGFAVGSIEEASELRKSGIKQKIIALLGTYPVPNESNIDLAKEYDITVLAHNERTLKEAVEARVPFALKWNTGMNRFGFMPDEANDVLEYLEANRDKIRFDVSMTHLATSDVPDDRGRGIMNTQLARFDEIKALVDKKFPQTLSSVGQSGYLLDLHKKSPYVVRLGVAMYGVNSYYKTCEHELGKGLQPVMHVQAPILELRTVDKGLAVGYGQNTPMKEKSVIASVGMGYADSYRRRYITPGIGDNLPEEFRVYGLYKGKRILCIDNICMQISFFDVTGLDAKVGDMIHILGGSGENMIHAEELALWWNTIAYEPLCCFGHTSEKILVD